MSVLLHSSQSGRWLQPLAIGGALRPTPSGANPVPKSYPLRFCPPGQRFSATVIVTS